MGRRPHLLPVLLLTLLSACRPLADRGEILVFLVRHAERADEGGMAPEEDPHLSLAGEERAGALARTLGDVGITHIHSTDYFRTRETAAPLAAVTGRSVSLYDAGDPAAFAMELKATPGRHLVVGHSNSIPDLVTALGGDSHGAIERMEYDRLYLVSIGPAGVETVLLRFGEPFRE
jgi:broad specificity phosphatase PhoE